MPAQVGPSAQKRRVLVVEDDSFVGALVCDALTSAGFLVERAAEAAAAMRAVQRFDPDAAILDISLGEGPSGLDVAHVLHRQRPDIAVLFLTHHPAPRTAGRPADALPPQAGFLRKERITETDYLVDALEAVLADRSDDVRDDRDPAKPMGALSQHQLEVLRLMAQGYTNEVIARRCEVSPKTVERWVGEIFKALGVSKQGDINPRVEVIRQFVAVAGLPGRRG